MMEERFKLIPKLTLSEMALRRAAVNLWCDPDISAHVGRYGTIGYPSVNDYQSVDGYQSAIWCRSVKGILEKVPKLVLPETLKKRLLQVVRPINAEVRRWHRFHEDVLKDAPDERLSAFILEPLRWTCAGAVDYRKTAEELLRLELFDVEKRYRLACLYCLEDCIPALWAKLPGEYKSRLGVLERPLPQNVVRLEHYWASVMKGGELNLNDILPAEFVDGSSEYLSFFRYSAHESSRAATEYFFQKLTDEERGNAAFRTLRDVLERDATSNTPEVFCVSVKAKYEIFYYMLSIITREQRTQVLEEYPFVTLVYLLEWPFLDVLLEATDIIWKFLPERFYGHALIRLISKLVCCKECTPMYYFPDLFLKIFIRSPSRFKQRFVDEECSRDDLLFFPSFVDDGDTERVKVIWMNLNSAWRWRLLRHKGFFQFLSRMLRTGKWQLVEFCFRELSKAQREVLREHYMEFARECPFRRPVVIISRPSPDKIYKRTTPAVVKEHRREKDWKLFFESLDQTGANALGAKFSEVETQRKRKNNLLFSFQSQSKIQCVRTSWGWSFGPEQR